MSTQIQFWNGGILFVGGQIALDPACCCISCILCPGAVPDTLYLDLLGIGPWNEGMPADYYCVDGEDADLCVPTYGNGGVPHACLKDDGDACHWRKDLGGVTCTYRFLDIWLVDGGDGTVRFEVYLVVNDVAYDVFGVSSWAAMDDCTDLDVTGPGPLISGWGPDGCMYTDPSFRIRTANNL